ncbi:pitrilysin family protein [Pseudorhodobacter sp. MZDSW-24AT]|uniref:M16 family metallopeptidase n=1 Tax=Pseudorhodobacter sp. MZDSW-24AT TaxID=2052957 RepID=UPI000C1F8158|nr:pitrilysin family protein [Pseudorhodobacter sp. MZDSW-24AT]PJF08621.1 peptidase M16 [Pseudorhodobacter sp. MZDSW-24AT]
MNILRTAALLLAFALPAHAEIEIQTVTSPGGITAWLAPEPGIPFTALEVRFRGGTSLDAEGKRGAVNLMTALIEEGTGDLDSVGFARARDSLAAAYSFSSDQDSLGVSARFLTENRDAAVDLLRRALTEPRFDQDAIDRVRGQVLAGLRQDAKDPGTLASQRLRAMAFGDHPYATSGDGTLESVTALSREDILAAHRATLARDRVYVAAAGDITAEELGPLLDTLLGGLPETGAPLVDRAPMNLTGGITVQDFPGPQATVLFGHQGIKRDDPDFFAASILNEILGGGRFSARLMTEVRDRRGLTYGIGSYLVGYDQAELLMGQFSSANATVGQAIEVIRDEWRKIATEGVSAEDLERTKTYLTGSYPLRFDGNTPIASMLVGMQMIGLDPDYPKTRNAKVEAVTLEDVKRVAATLFREGDLRFVVVGQPEGVTSTDGP